MSVWTRELWRLYGTNEELQPARCFYCGAQLWLHRNGDVLGSHDASCAGADYPCVDSPVAVSLSRNTRGDWFVDVEFVESGKGLSVPVSEFEKRLTS